MGDRRTCVDGQGRAQTTNAMASAILACSYLTVNFFSTQKEMVSEIQNRPCTDSANGDDQDVPVSGYASVHVQRGHE